MNEPPQDVPKLADLLSGRVRVPENDCTPVKLQS